MVRESESSEQWELEIGGLKLPVTEAGVTLGRDPECELPLSDERASWRHVKISLAEGGTVIVTDLESKNGTFVNGRRLDDGPRVLTSASMIQFGSTRARLSRPERRDGPASGAFRRVSLRSRSLRIGRAPDNDVCLDEPNVSWHHAEIRPGNPPTLLDHGSRNGVRLGERMVSGSAQMPDGAVAGIGPFTLQLNGEQLIVTDERGGQRLSAHEIAVDIGERYILYPTSISVAPGEFVALIGASGSGKTTLLKCLAGVREPSLSHVTLGPDPVALRQTDVGYVPQSDVVHDRLTVRETLDYTARLRLPADTKAEERRRAVAEVISELRLEPHAETMVGSLSGGQRKRVGCGVELIGNPTMLLMDEPTSGLDPPLETRLMMTLRNLADRGRGVVVVTHATSNLALCDTVALMGEGGHLLYAGSPDGALAHFGVAAFDELYGAAELVDTSTVPIPSPPTSSPPRPPRRRLISASSLPRHALALTTRYGRTFWRDGRTLIALLAQAPIIALLIGVLYPSGVLELPDSNPTRSAQFVFLLVTAALWLGLIDSCREIVRERAIIVRELTVGVRLDAQLIAKSSVLFALAAVQCTLLLGVVSLIQPLHTGSGETLTLLGLLVLTSWSTVALGLLVSTLARSVDQATSVIPLLLIPQLLFGGALVAVAKMSTAVAVLSDLIASRWAFAGAGETIGMNARLSHASDAAALSGYGLDFFSLSAAAAAAVLLGFVAVFLLGAATVLARRRPDA